MKKSHKNINKLRAEGQKKIEARMANPFIRGGLDKFQAEQYDGVNTSNGEILRIRAVNKIAKDASGRYVYTAQLASTSDEQNVELFSPDVKVPVVFTLPYRLNDIVNTEYEATYKKQLEKADYYLITDDKMQKELGGTSYQQAEYPLGDILAKLAYEKLKSSSAKWQELKPLYIQPPPMG